LWASRPPFDRRDVILAELERSQGRGSGRPDRRADAIAVSAIGSPPRRRSSRVLTDVDAVAAAVQHEL
jgi:hypothetical protein